MIVSRVELVEFMAHTSSEVELPRTGLVLITGPNGAGKSSIVEAVATACWGETLRGDSPWRGKGGGRVSVDLLGLVKQDATTRIERCQSGSPRLRFFTDAASSETVYETTSKAQEALDRLIPSFGVWRRASVLSSADAAAFGRATDAERKRMLEELLGLELFEAASNACRQDLHNVERHLSDAARELSVLDARAKELGKRLEDARAWCVAQEDTEQAGGLRERLASLEEKVRRLESAVRDAHASHKTAWDSQVRADQAVRDLTSRCRALEDGLCPTCGRLVHSQIVNNFRRDLEEAKSRLKEAAAALREETTRLDAAQASLDAARGEKNRCEAQASELQRRQGKIAEAKRKLEQISDEFGSVLAERADVKDEHDILAKELSELRAADRILSTKGVRAHLLENALGSIEQIANSYLDRLAGAELKLHLSPYSEKAKGGGVKDSIGMTIEGGRGYRGASGGERRRIDLALALALGEVAAAASGTAPGTLFLDEAFDSLDDAGREAASTVISALAQDRCVVLVSHDAGLQRSLSGVTRHYRIEGGVVR